MVNIIRKDRHNSEMSKAFGSSTKGSPHAVQAIGWGQDEVTGIPYWIVKNSWGPNWGENGFAKIQQGQCGIDQGVSHQLAMLITHF